MIIRLVKYYWFSLKARLLLGYSAADFISQGIGIKARSNRFKGYWTKHFDYTKNFIINCYNREKQIKTVLVLGAGALNDLPVRQMLDAGLKIFLVDLDLAAKKIWAEWKIRYPTQISYVVCDVTGRLAEWTRLANICKFDQLESLLFEQDPILDKLLDQKFDIVISLNILSQLGVIWKDRLFAANSIEDQEALENLSTNTTRLLEKEHLDLLSRSCKLGFILISDKYFHYYKQEQPDWQTEFATSIDYEQYLFNDKTISMEHQDCWLWHLRPANTEGLDYGEIHHIRAYLFLKNK